MSDQVAQLLARVRSELQLSVQLTSAGKIELDASCFSLPKWPKKLDPQRCVVIDTTAAADGYAWPTPRFEILIANLDSIGLAVVQVGDPSSEKLQRAQQHFVRLAPPERAAVIQHAQLWIGHDTLWRTVAAAVGKPQVVIALNKIVPVWKNTFVVDSAGHAPESAALGPVSVTSVATAVRDALKQLGVPAQL